MCLEVKRNLFAPNDAAHIMQRVTILSSGAFAGPVPLEIIFAPDGETAEYVVEGDLIDGQLQLWNHVGC